MSKKLNFHWDSFQEHSKVMLQNMMSSKFSDVTLMCEDRKKIPAHRNILSACSPVLKDILEDIGLSELKHPIIYLKGIKYQEMKSILHFSYMGQVDVLPDRVGYFLSSAKSLEIEGLNTEKDPFEQQTKRTKVEEEDEECTVKEDTYEDSNKENEDMDVGFNDFVSILLDDNLDQSKEKDRSKGRPPKDGAKFNCKQCNRSYYNRRSLWLHRKNIHGGTQYSCDECDFATGKAMHLRDHMATIHNVSCRIKFDNYNSKSCASPEENGMEAQNTEEPNCTKILTKKTYKCNKCTFRSEIQESLIKHMKTHLKKISFKNEENLPGQVKLNPWKFSSA